MPKALAVFQRYAKVLTPAQRRQVAELIRESIDVQPARTLGKVAPKYGLPNGETWAGRGLAPQAFSAWAKSVEDRAWANANPAAKFPPADGAVNSSPTRAVKKASRATTAVKPIKKAAKKAVKKAVKKAIKKAIKKA